MNVLVLVMSCILIVGIMTAARLETFRSFTVVQVEFKRYIEKKERSSLNKESKKWYDKIVASKREGETKQNEASIQADKKLDFRVFVDKTERVRKNPLLQQYWTLARNLMQYLYKDKKFFIDASEKVPDLINQILQALVLASDELTREEQLKTVKQIANLDLKDKELNLVWYQMLQGVSTDDDRLSYPSLLNFIDLNKHEKLRIYLASRPVLYAVFRNEDTVRRVIEKREELYRELIRTPKEERSERKKALSLEFSSFMQDVPSDIQESLLNFDISGTNPSNYR